MLCELEGLTYQEAAQRLRCPVGTIGVRLRRARERLRERLTRRGLAPTAGLIGATLFGADAASADVPSVLVDSTVQAAMGFAATPVLALSRRRTRDHGPDPAEGGGDSGARGRDHRDHRLVGHSATDHGCGRDGNP